MELLHNRFEIIKRLSDTQVFRVYLCKDLKKGNNVSLYEIKEAFMQDIGFVNGLTQGIIDCRELKHQNTMTFLDMVMDQEKESIAFVYEYVDGVSLKEIFTRQAKLPIHKSIEIAVNVLQSLDNAHLMGICHGDLYPEDILITQDGNVKVRGYGRKDGIENSDIAKEHLSLETIKYQSPEVLDCQGIYESSDVYSAGVILYQMLTGKLPFDGNTSVEIATKALRDAPLSPRMINRELSASLSSLILESIAKEYNSRVKTASMFVSRLNDVLRRENQGEYAKPQEKVLIKHEEEEKKKSVIPMLIVLFLVVLILTTAISIAATGGHRTKVPNLIGLTEEDAISKLQGLKLSYEKGEDAFSDEVAAGVVCDQSPQSSSKIGKNDKVIYILSKGMEKAKMPYIVGLDYDSAKEKLAMCNFDVEVLEEYSGSVPSGTVVRTIPDSNTSLDNGAHVMIVISKGSKNTADTKPDYGNSQNETTEKTAFDDEAESRKTDTEVSERETERKREVRERHRRTREEKPEKQESSPKTEKPAPKPESKPAPKPEDNNKSQSSYSSSASDAKVEFD